MKLEMELRGASGDDATGQVAAARRAALAAAKAIVGQVASGNAVHVSVRVVAPRPVAALAAAPHADEGQPDAEPVLRTSNAIAAVFRVINATKEKRPRYPSRPVLAAVRELLRVRGCRMSAGQIREDLAAAGAEWDDRTVNGTLGAAVKAGLLLHDRGEGGYALPEQRDAALAGHPAAGVP